MKKLFMLFAVIFIFTGLAFSQGGGILGDIDINTVFASLAGVAAGSVFISALLIKWFKTEKGWVKQLVSWIAPIVIFAVGNLLNIGFMAEFSWLMTIVYGLGAGLVSNGLFDIALVQALLVALNLKKKPAA
jgi:hypothetical protein